MKLIELKLAIDMATIPTNHRLTVPLFLKNGRDHDTVQFDLEIDEPVPYAAMGLRVGQFAHALHLMTRTRFVAVHDWKGCLTVVWSKAPTWRDMDVAQTIWYNMCEALISHIYIDKDGKAKPVVCEVGDTTTPYDIDFVLHNLGLTTV